MRILTLVSLLFSITNIFAAQTDFAVNKGWYAYRDLTDSGFSSKFNELRSKGYRMTDVEAYQVGSSMRYAMLWEKNDNRSWAEHRNLTSSQYNAKWRQYRDQGYRPTDIEGYRTDSNSTRFAGVWINNREQYKWVSVRNLSSSAYAEKFQELKNQGYYPVDLEAYDSSNGLQFAAIWYKHRNNPIWVQSRNLTRSQYQDAVNQNQQQGFAMVDYERYDTSSGARYAAIWHKGETTKPIVRTNRNELQYANLYREYRDDGYRPVDFERDGNAYGAIWAKAIPRVADYPPRKDLNNLLSEYAEAENLPGISAAIYHNGRLVWSHGEGETSQSGKVAHGYSIYPIASVSKVIGGTLFGKLEENGALNNGARVNIKGSDRTDKHLRSVPAEHSHRLRNILAHTSCITHYSSGESSSCDISRSFGIGNVNTHYSNQVDAAKRIWREGLLDNCSIGGTKCYSTHAFTLLGAALEAASGKTVPALIKDELALPFRLPSLRAMYTTSNLPSNYERSSWYSNNSVTSRGNNSWKVFGGGIESNAVDLARFGWLTGTGRITSKEFRDNVLFATQANSSYAYAWRVDTINSRRRARHGGSWTGARSELAVWPDDSLAIAILSNQSGHDGLASLASAMANLVLDQQL